MFTPGWAPGPTRSASAFATTRSSSASWTASTAITRLVPVQACPAEPEGALDDQRCGAVEVGVLGDHHRVLPTHLQLHATLRSDDAMDGPADLGGTGECDGRDPGFSSDRSPPRRPRPAPVR